jgi:hypothetical protein
LDNGAYQEVNGDTLFELGSITTFATLLLQNLSASGEMKSWIPRLPRNTAGEGVPANSELFWMSVRRLAPFALSPRRTPMPGSPLSGRP